MQCLFKKLKDRNFKYGSAWKLWILELNEPEASLIPDNKENINSDPNIKQFIHLCIDCAVREDRTELASR